MSGRYVIGLDVGTTCTKALAVDETGAVISEGSAGYRLISEGAKIEQSAADWITACAAAIRKATEGLNPSAVAGISLSTQGGSTVPVDAEGNFLSDAWTWMDTRSIPEADELRERLGDSYIYRTTGWKLNPALDAAKILRMKRTPELAGARYYWTTLEIVNRWLTGEAVIDPTNCAIRQLFNISENRWDDRILAEIGLSVSELPEVRPTGALVGRLSAGAAEATGLPVGVPVFNGAHDQYCASIGAGAVNDGDLLLSAGTTWVVMGISRAPLFTESYIAPGKHPVEGLYGAIASLVCSGASLQWFRDGFLSEDLREVDCIVAERREKTRDLMFYPYMAGANYPIWNLNARGSFVGIGLEHDRFDFARAIMEGVAFGVRRATEDFAANGTDIRAITMMGGAAKSPVWMQMIASVTGIPIRRLNQADVCALGAAAIAACGAGFFADYACAARAMVHTERTYAPDPAETGWYAEKFSRFDAMWRAMAAYYAK